MEESKTREKILKKIRAALIDKTPNRFPKLDFDSPVYKISEDPLEIQFAQEFKKVNGHFIFCENEKEFAEQVVPFAKERNWKKIYSAESRTNKILDSFSISYESNHDLLNTCDTAITLCESLVARTGTVFVSSRQSSGRRAPVFPDNHLVLAYTSQLVPDMKDALIAMKSKYGEQLPSMISAITGPSRTADIEKTLVQGAHGPKEIYVFLVDDSPSE